MLIDLDFNITMINMSKERDEKIYNPIRELESIKTSNVKCISKK